MDAGATTSVAINEPDAAAEKFEKALATLAPYVTCRPGRPLNGCNGTGVRLAVVGKDVKGKDVRIRQLCSCIENEVERHKVADAARTRTIESAAALAAAAVGITPLPAPPRHIPIGAKTRHQQLSRELARETGRLTTMRENVGAAIAGVADELAALTAEEASNRRESTAAQAMQKLASEQLEAVRARLAGLQGDIEQAKATIELLTNQAGQFGARRMQAEARIAAERKRLAPDEKAAADRIASLDYRMKQHLARWPELEGAGPS